jgi:inner membrane protein involved in colicin E2 resistance
MPFKWIIDVMKEYSSSAGSYAIVADSALMISSVGIAMIAKGMELHSAVFLGLLALYGIPYILETRNDYSTLT